MLEDGFSYVDVFMLMMRKFDRAKYGSKFLLINCRAYGEDAKG